MKIQYTLLAVFLLTAATVFGVTEEFHMTYGIDANGTLSLENVNGDVTITTWNRNEVKVDAVKRAESTEKLKEAEIEIDATKQRISIETVYPKYKNQRNPASVDYTITVPASLRLEDVSLVNGDLSVEGVQGDVDASSVNGKLRVVGLMSRAELSTVNGSLEAVFDNVVEDISLETVNGRIKLELPSNVSANFDVDTLNGSINNSFGLKPKKGRYVGNELNGTIGSGAVQIKVDSVNGSVDINTR